MDPSPKKSPWPRRLRRLTLLVAALGALFATWILFFPVPLTWAARRAFPSDGPLQLAVETVTFRWRWGQPTLALEVKTLTATARARPLLTVGRIVVEIPKSGLWHRHFAPSQITLTAPKLQLDRTPAGALALLAPANPTPPPAAAPPGPPDLSAFAAVMPRPGESTQLIVDGLSILLRTAAGEATVPFGPIQTTLAQNPAGALQLDLAVPLIGGTQPLRLTVHASLVISTGRTEFSIRLPAFGTSDLPVLPGAPPLPLRAIVALDAAGHFNLATSQLEDVTGGVSVSDGEFSLPGGAKIPVEKIDLRGRYDHRTQHLVLSPGSLRLGALAVSITELDATLSADLRARWQIELTGLNGAVVLPLLPADLRSSLPLSPEAISAITLNRLTTRGDATLTRDASATWSSRILQSAGLLELALGSELLTCTWNLLQPEKSPVITLETSLAAFVPARWPAALIAGTPAAALDLPLTLTAQATLTPTGLPRSARLALLAAPGTLKPLQPGLPALTVQRFEVRVASEQFDRAWEVPLARLELANGARAELTHTRLDLAPGQFALQGEARAEGFSGEFAAVFMPPGSWAPLTAAGLAPRDVSLDHLRVHFNAKAAQVSTRTELTALTANAEARLRLRAAPLNLSAQVTLPEAGRQIEATVDVAEFRPAQFGLTLADGLTTAAFDVPVTLHATARASLTGELLAAGAQLRIGAGRVKTPPAYGDLDLPVRALTLDARFDPARQRAHLETLRLDAGGLRLKFTDVATSVAPPQIVTGRLEIEPFALATALALWPASQQPALRQQMLTTLRAGEFMGAKFDAELALQPGAQPSLKISRLHGTAQLAKIAAAPAGVPGPVTLAGLQATVDYPHAVVELENLVLPGANITTARARVEALDTLAPIANLTANFETDLAAANRIWKFAPPDLLTGAVQGQLTLSAPFTAETIDARLTLDLARVKFPLPGFPNAAPTALDAGIRISHALATTVAPTVDFTLAAPQWLGAPLRLTGRAALTAGDYQPMLIELTAYEHGRTRLAAKFSRASATHQDISITGAYLDTAPLLRFGLATADTFAAVPVPAPATAVSRPLSNKPVTPALPVTAGIDVRIDEVAFGPAQNARQLQLRTRLENNAPTSLTLQATTGADNRLDVALDGPANHQIFKLKIGDAAGWLRTFTAPWHATPPAPGQFGSLVLQLMKVPSIVAGGGVTAEADIRPGQPEWLSGRLRLTHATLVRAPRVLQALALKTGKSLQKSPLIEDFSLGQLTLSSTELRVADIALAGSGLIDSLKIKSAAYGLTDDKLYVDGTYFGVGFEVKNTLASPEIWLKDSNLLIRSIGTRKENFGFDDEPEAKPTPKK